MARQERDSITYILVLCENVTSVPIVTHVGMFFSTFLPENRKYTQSNEVQPYDALILAIVAIPVRQLSRTTSTELAVESPATKMNRSCCAVIVL